VAAELTYDKDGKAQMFSVKETPWHGEGKVLTEAPTYADALKLAGFDYPLVKMPYLMPVEKAGEWGPQGKQFVEYKEAGDAFYVWRSDTKKPLGAVGSSYEIVTNEDAFRPLEPLVDSGVLKLETGGVLRDGADAWLMGRWDLSKFGDTAREVFGEEVLPFATVMANHSGRRGVLLGQTPVRIVCANTLGAAEADGVSRWESIAHVAGANLRLVEVATEMFAKVIEKYEVIAAQYKLLMATTLTPEMFKQLVLDVAAPDPTLLPSWNPEAKMAESVVARVERKRARVTELWTSGKGHSGEPTAWFAYNGAVEALDHDKGLFPTRAGCYRTASLLGGTLAKAKEQVLDGLVQYAQGM
jgi:phage/plasmid-like protein (TIGR03299 family)